MSGGQEQDLSAVLADALVDAYAVEERSLQTLQSIASTTDDPGVCDGLRRHETETERHLARLAERLAAFGREPSTAKQASGLLAATVEAFVDEARDDHARQNVRDLYAAEYGEIATYELLERLATRAGDADTVQAARANRRDEEAMTSVIEANWDRFLDAALVERSG